MQALMLGSLRASGFAPVVLGALLFADVPTRCGEKPPGPETMDAKPWSPCDPKGRISFRCTQGTSCMSMKPEVDIDGYRAYLACTKACTTDADCASMGVDFTCSAKGFVAPATEPGNACARKPKSRADAGGG